MSDDTWPALSLDSWQDTYATVHLWTQVVGKIAIALGPPLNHSWGIAFHPTGRGWTTQLLAHGSRTFTIEFDFIDHQLLVRATDGEARTLALQPQTVAAFYASLMAALRDMQLPVTIWPMSVEMPVAVRIDTDFEHRSYDAAAMARCWRVMTRIMRILADERSAFIGKCSPAHFFWGGFDVACTRFSGRPAPPREGPAFMREAYSHEVISHGFWCGGAPVLEPVFYAYAVPEPEGLKQTTVGPRGAYYHLEMGEFILPYEAVRTSPTPEQDIREFVRTTYAAAATLAKWDRAALERA